MGLMTACETKDLKYIFIHTDRYGSGMSFYSSYSCDFIFASKDEGENAYVILPNNPNFTFHNIQARYDYNLESSTAGLMTITALTPCEVLSGDTWRSVNAGEIIAQAYYASSMSVAVRFK